MCIGRCAQESEKDKKKSEEVGLCKFVPLTLNGKFLIKEHLN